MHLLTKLDKYIIPLTVLCFIVVHIFLFNVNATEWGDSYRILRAAKSLQTHQVYPSDEKRPPLLSIIISLNPLNIDFVVWGKVILFIFSIAFFYTFAQFLRLFDFSKNSAYIFSLVLSLSPVVLYWSIRVMADLPFAVLALLAVYAFIKYSNRKYSNNSVYIGSLYKNWFFVGLLVGLSILMRFEGYLLMVACLYGVGVLGFKPASFAEYFDFKSQFNYLRKNIVAVVAYLSGVFMFVLPLWFYRNPFTSSYLSEPGGRVYDLKMVITYILSFLFMYGCTYYFGVLMLDRRHIKLLINTPVLLAYFVLEMILILVWPAAIPRLFVAISFVPALLIFKSLVNFYDLKKHLTIKQLLLLFGFFLTYVVTQYTLRLQFLVPFKSYLMATIVLQMLLFALLVLKRYKLFVISSCLFMLVWSVFVIKVHENILRTPKEAAEYAVTNLSGLVGYNDVSSVSDWYLNSNNTSQINGVFYDINSKESKSYEMLRHMKINYLLVTNEHNPNLEIDVKSRLYLEEIAEFRYNTLGTDFWTKVIMVK